MPPITLYVCELCGTQYKNQADAEKCERQHKKPVRIAKCKHLSYTQCGTGIPVNVTVEFEDGSQLVYKR